MTFKLEASTVNRGTVVDKDIKVTIGCYKCTKVTPRYLSPEANMVPPDVRFQNATTRPSSYFFKIVLPRNEESKSEEVFQLNSVIEW